MIRIIVILFGFVLLLPKGAMADFKFTVSSVTVQEGVSSTIALTIERIGNTAGAASAQVRTIDATAIAGFDYNPIVGTLSWADGSSTTRNISISIINDTVFESTETFIVTLTDLASGFTQDAEVTILNDDPPPVFTPGQITVSLLTSTTVVENAGGISFKISREGGIDGPLSIHYDTQNGSAQSGFDFTQTSGLVLFPDQYATPAIITIPLLNDANVESDESFQLSLEWLDGALAGQTQIFAYTISDDDLPIPPSSNIPSGRPSKNLVDLSKSEQAELVVNLTQADTIQIRIFDRVGRQIKEIQQDGTSGDNLVFWNGRDDSEMVVPTGVYTALIKANGSTQKLSIILLK